jgi:hypothetical protein
MIIKNNGMDRIRDRRASAYIHSPIIMVSYTLNVRVEGIKINPSSVSLRLDLGGTDGTYPKEITTATKGKPRRAKTAAKGGLHWSPNLFPNPDSGLLALALLVPGQHRCFDRP